ncbi:GDP/GTP exchange factor [Phlyctema vagabunda]|uniref:GDP/GTP exchange factor n=1 Tax=Phlyctema vagabunda TaxID=108571 RepID=A0ABR4PBF0_9HELO
MPPKQAASKAASATAAPKATSKAQPAKAPAVANTASKRKADSEIDERKTKKSKAPTAAAKPKKAVAAKRAVKPVAKPAAKKAAPVKPTAKKAAEEIKDEESDEEASDVSIEEPAPKKAIAKTITKKAVAKTVTKKSVSKEPTPARSTASREPAAKPAPKPKVAKAPKPARKKQAGPAINSAPTQKLDIYVFGEGSSGELGLGSIKYDGKMPIDVKRPRINEKLSAKTVGVVQLAVGGMHCAALTHDNKILTWGVNDQGALGRDTKWDGGLKDMDAKDEDSDSDDDDTGMNPRESTPTEIDTSSIEEETYFTQVVCSDSATFALTAEGLVYGWGTFRGNDGILGFRAGIKAQLTPVLVPELKKVVCLATGTNHVLAVNAKGKVFGWGAGEQSQLARRVVSRTATGALIPREFGLQRKNITYVACGDYHSFAVDNKGKVYAWGLNTFGQTGVPKGEGDEENAVIKPTVVESLKDYNIKQIDGGAHHTISCTEEGEVLIWGRIDNAQGGMDVSDFPKEKVFFDEHDKPRYLVTPHVIPDLKASSVSSGPDTCIVITQDGKAYSWGFSGNYQTGQGTEDEVEEATQIANTAVVGKKLVFAGAGGQFSVLAGVAGQLSNGV